MAWRYGPTLLLGPVVIAAPLVRQELVQTLVASGHLATRFRSEIGTQISGVVVRIPVGEGETVAAGDTLIILDDAESRALMLQAVGAVQQADAQSRQMRELTLPAAEQALAQASAARLSAEQALRRNLSALGLDAPAALDEARKSLNMLRAAEQAAELTVRADRPGGSAATVIATQRTQAGASLSAARTRLQYRAILAPRAGVLISRSVEVGDVAQPGKVLLLLSPAGDMDIVVQVDEKQLGLIAVGQHALASADAFPAQRFSAEVRFINPGVDLLRASVEVRLRVPNPPAMLRQDMTVSVDIETARRPQALVVSSEDIGDRTSANPWVLVVREGRAQRQAVRLGLMSAGKAEILAGVNAGDTVVPLGTGTITSGQRLRIRRPAAQTL